MQWYVNDSLVVGANSATFTLNDVTSTATVKLQVFSPARCASPDTAFSNIIGVHFNTGVHDPGVFSSVDLYPNPGAGIFQIKGVLPGYASGNIRATISNAVGQLIYTELMPVKQDNLSSTLDLGSLPDGVYFIELSGEGKQKSIRYTLKH